MVKMAGFLAPKCFCDGVEVPKISGRCHISTVGLPHFFWLSSLWLAISSLWLTISSLWLTISSLWLTIYQAYGSPYIKPMARHISSLWLAICMIRWAIGLTYSKPKVWNRCWCWKTIESENTYAWKIPLHPPTWQWLLEPYYISWDSSQLRGVRFHKGSGDLVVFEKSLPERNQ